MVPLYIYNRRNRVGGGRSKRPGLIEQGLQAFRGFWADCGVSSGWSRVTASLENTSLLKWLRPCPPTSGSLPCMFVKRYEWMMDAAWWALGTVSGDPTVG